MLFVNKWDFIQRFFCYEFQTRFAKEAYLDKTDKIFKLFIRVEKRWDLQSKICTLPIHAFIQLNEYKTDPYFLQNFQSDMTVCLIIHMFCKSCEPEIVLQIKTKTIARSQTLQNVWIIKQTVVLLWKFLRKYGSVSYLFICNCFAGHEVPT